MSETVKQLVTAMLQKDAMGTESAFQTAMAEKISAKLDDMRISVAQSMFKSPEAATESPAAELAVEEGYDPERMKDGDMMGGAGGGDISADDKKKKKTK